uniref:Uncharacterized protein n=1 Tax=Cannabis sativa TaxID=3483 RepID=A0A803PWM7_CANSA
MCHAGENCADLDTFGDNFDDFDAGNIPEIQHEPPPKLIHAELAPETIKSHHYGPHILCLLVLRQVHALKVNKTWILVPPSKFQNLVGYDSVDAIDFFLGFKATAGAGDGAIPDMVVLTTPVDMLTEDPSVLVMFNGKSRVLMARPLVELPPMADPAIELAIDVMTDEYSSYLVLLMVLEQVMTTELMSEYGRGRGIKLGMKW